MGTWGSDSFDNDDAADWLAEFSEEPSMEIIRDTLATVADYDDEYLELPECGAAIAAAEVVAALSGAASPKLPKEIRAWIGRQAKGSYPELNRMSIRAVERIKRDSEMKELWEERGEAEQWYSAVKNLEMRLKANAV
jgi:acyl-CoA hydrolase